MPIPHRDSLNAILLQASTSNEALPLRATMSAFYNSNEGIDERYKIVIDGGESVRNDRLADIIFADDPDVTARRKAVLGDMDRQKFDARFKAGRKLNREKFIELTEIFAKKSLPETYFHPQIARTLATGPLSKPDTVAQRILETGLIVGSALSKQDGLGMMLAMGRSHDARARELYNEDTVEFTLLTFSYFGAKAAGMTEVDWFFFWRVFGSMMGLGPDRLHDTYDQAGQRMKELHKQCPEQPDQNSKKLLETFRQAFLGTPEKIREACQGGTVSKRMESYLKAGGHWPSTLANRHAA
jgi:hypothetical protein